MSSSQDAGNAAAMRKALTDLVNYLNKEVKRTSKCKRCRYRGRSFRGEPCYWHIDCGIDEYDDEASDNAMHLLKRFKLQEALAAPPRNCDRFGGDNALLQKAYLSECGGNYNPLDANSRQAYLVGYGNWLLTPAKKGTAK